MPSRRRVLALAATSLGVSAGCVAEPPTGGATADAALGPPLEDGDRVRARAPAVSVDRKLELGDHQTYVESNDTVEYPKSTSGRDEFTYGYIDTAEWRRLEAGFVAKDAVGEQLRARLPDLGLLAVHMTGRGGPGMQLEVVHSTSVDDGMVVDEPAVSAAALVAVTPRAVEVAVRFRGETYSATYPVFVVKTVGQNRLDQSDDGTTAG